MSQPSLRCAMINSANARSEPIAVRELGTGALPGQHKGSVCKGQRL